MMIRLSLFLRSFRRSQSGLSAIEFAMLLPVMAALYFGSIELSDLLIADRKATTLASTTADLVAQDTQIDNDDMDNIMDAARAILAPFNPALVTIRISSVVADVNGVTTVAWSDAINTGPRAPGSAVENLPDDLVAPGGSVIMSEVTYSYESLTGIFLTGSAHVVSDRFYLRPRRTAQIVRVP